MSNIQVQPTVEELIEIRRNFIEECKPFIKALAEIHKFKIPKYTLNVDTGEFDVDWGIDSPAEKQLRHELELVKGRYSKYMLP